MNRFLFALLSVLPVIACHSPEKPSPPEASASDSTEKRNYFPVENILKAEIASVDSMPYRMMLYHQQNGKKDSLLLHPGQFDAQANAFLVPGIDSEAIARRFTESSFMDQSSGMLTFTYSTKDSLFGLRRVDVLAEPSLSEDKVRSIYLEVSARENDSLKVKRMTWVSGKYFSITEVIHAAQGGTVTRETRVVWNND